MSENERSVDFDGYWELDVTKTSWAADGTTLDVNGTQLFLKRHEHVPVIVEIYVEDEQEPIGAISVAKGCTVTLGGVHERISKDIAEAAEELRENADRLDRIAHRSNPTGTANPEADE